MGISKTNIIKGRFQKYAIVTVNDINVYGEVFYPFHLYLGANKKLTMKDWDGDNLYISNENGEYIAMESVNGDDIKLILPVFDSDFTHFISDTAMTGYILGLIPNKTLGVINLNESGRNKTITALSNKITLGPEYIFQKK